MHSLLIILAAALYLLACAVTCLSIYRAPEGQETEAGFAYSQSNRKKAPERADLAQGQED